VTAFVAASTQDAVKELVAKFTKDTGIAVKISAGASNTLANQVLNGANADLFLSASQDWADQLREKGLAVAAHPLLTNELVLVVPKGNPGRIKTPKDLLNENVKYLALAGEKVPAGVYAEQALTADGLYTKLLEQKRSFADKTCGPRWRSSNEEKLRLESSMRPMHA